MYNLNCLQFKDTSFICGWFPILFLGFALSTGNDKFTGVNLYIYTCAYIFAYMLWKKVYKAVNISGQQWRGAVTEPTSITAVTESGRWWDLWPGQESACWQCLQLLLGIWLQKGSLRFLVVMSLLFIVWKHYWFIGCIVWFGR